MSLIKNKKTILKEKLEGMEDRIANREMKSIKHNAYVRRWIRGELGALRRYEIDRGRRDGSSLNGRGRKS